MGGYTLVSGPSSFKGGRGGKEKISCLGPDGGSEYPSHVLEQGYPLSLSLLSGQDQNGVRGGKYPSHILGQGNPYSILPSPPDQDRNTGVKNCTVLHFHEVFNQLKVSLGFEQQKIDVLLYTTDMDFEVTEFSLFIDSNLMRMHRYYFYLKVIKYNIFTCILLFK